MFYLILLTLTQVMLTMSTFTMTIVDFAMDRGIPKWNAVLLLTLYTVVDVIAKLGSGWISDKGFLTRSSMMATHLVVMSVSAYLASSCWSYECFIPVSLASGWCNGVTLVLAPVLLMELVDTDVFSVCFGIASFFPAVGLLLRPLLIGKNLDAVE